MVDEAVVNDSGRWVFPQQGQTVVQLRMDNRLSLLLEGGAEIASKPLSCFGLRTGAFELPPRS